MNVADFKGTAMFFFFSLQNLTLQRPVIPSSWHHVSPMVPHTLFPLVEAIIIDGDGTIQIEWIAIYVMNQFCVLFFFSLFFRN